MYIHTCIHVYTYIFTYIYACIYRGYAKVPRSKGNSFFSFFKLILAPLTLTLELWTLDPKPWTLDPAPYTLELGALNPEFNYSRLRFALKGLGFRAWDTWHSWVCGEKPALLRRHIVNVSVEKVSKVRSAQLRRPTIRILISWQAGCVLSMSWHPDAGSGSPRARWGGWR